jgi:hypothetical protein
VAGYPYLITLRQLHYRLLSVPGLDYENTEADYNRLSALTAEGRRDGSFPDLRDDTRTIHEPPSWDSPKAAIRWAADVYRRDRTEGQQRCVVLAGEKTTLLAQLDDWFGDLGPPFVLLRGNPSQTYVDQVAARVANDGRPSVLIYAGDLDAKGEDILRDFVKRCPVWDDIVQVAVTENQIGQLGLVVGPGNPKDSTARAFVARHPNLGLAQVEVEAIAPNDLRQLYQDALDAVWDDSAAQRVLDAEDADRRRLVGLAQRMK